jgi:Ran GTPase-activating protein (RanGAP) involved in mRNA processing and transport
MAFVGFEGFGVEPSSSQGTGEAVASSSAPAGVFIGSTAPAAAASTSILSGLGGIGGAGAPTPVPPAAGVFIGSTAPAAAASSSILSGLGGLGGLGAAAPAVSLGAPACGFAAAPADCTFRPSSFDGGEFGFGGYAEFGGGMVGRAAHTDPTLEVLQQIQTRDPALITSLDFRGLGVLRTGLLFPAIAHLTAMTYLNLSGLGLGSSGASHLCSALTYLTAMTYLNLQNNGLTADDGARICGAAAAAGMTRLETLDVVDTDRSFVCNHFLSAADVVGCETWRQLNVLLPPLPDHFLHVEDFGLLVQYLASSDKAAFADAHHPDLPLELLRRIRTSDLAISKLEIKLKRNFKEAGCRVLARALSLNTCITSLELGGTIIGDTGASLLFPAIAHLTAMTHLSLSGAGIGSSGASHLCSSLTHLTTMTVISLCGLHLSILDLPLFFRSLSQCRSISSLTLRNCRLGCEGLLIVLSALEHLKELSSLDISGNLNGCFAPDFSSEMVNSICATMTNSSLESQRMMFYRDNRQVSTVGITFTSVVAALKRLSSLTSLNLSYNDIAADDGARLCHAAAASGMTRLETLDLGLCSASHVVECETWRQLDLPQPPELVVAFTDSAILVQYLMISDKAAFADAHHPDLPLELLRRIRTSDPALTQLEIRHKRNFLEAGCRVLARALSLNTCITSLNLHCTSICDAGASLLFPAIAHLTAMTHLMLKNTSLESSGASHLCSALTHFTAMTCLDLSFNRLTADDGARICGAAAAAGMTRLQMLELERNCFYSPSDVVECGAWELLNLPQPLDNVDHDSRGCDCISLVMYAIRLRYAVSLVLTAAATCPIFGLRRRSHVFQFQGPPQIIVRQRHQSSNVPDDDEERGESAFVHHLHPCPQIGFSMSRRSLDFAALQLWCHCNPQYLRLLICCCPLSTLAFRLARTSNRHDSQRMAQHRAAALVMRRCFSMLAWRIWTGSTPNYPSFSVLL